MQIICLFVLFRISQTRRVCTRRDKQDSKKVEYGAAQIRQYKFTNVSSGLITLCTLKPKNVLKTNLSV